MLKWKGFYWFVLVLFPLLAASPALPASRGDIAEGPVTIEADSISYNEDEDAVHAAGKVVITFTRGLLKADTVTLYRETNLALAEGHVLIHSDQDVIEGEKVFFNIESKTGTVDSGKLFVAQNHLYAKGDKIEKKGESTYRLENGKVTTCDGETPDWSLAASEINVTIDGYGSMKHGRFLTRDIPLLYVPYFFFPAKTTRQSGLLFPFFSLLQRKERSGCGTALLLGHLGERRCNLLSALYGETRLQGRRGATLLPQSLIVRNNVRRFYQRSQTGDGRPSDR